MIKFIRYIYHLFRHKYFIWQECWKEGLYLQGLIHDLSKLRWDEIKFYSRKYAGDDDYNGDFKMARMRHQKRNRHHWRYWVIDENQKKAVEMPLPYLLEMVCDWRAMSRTWKYPADRFYRKNHMKMILHPKTRRNLEKILNEQEVTL